MTRPVTVTRLAERDIAQAQDDYESREPGLGNRFVEQVRSTINRIGQNPFQYQVVPDSFGSRRAPVRRFPWSVWYQVLPDESAARSHYVRVIDNEGEDYLYPADYFIFMEFPHAVEQALLQAS